MLTRNCLPRVRPLPLLIALCAMSGAFCAASVGRAAEHAPAADDTKSRIETVGQLIHRSSAARQITDSGDQAAMAKYNAAKESYERAVQANGRGDAQSAKRLLEEASRTMFEAVRLAKPQAAVADKKRGDFNKRLASLNGLLVAYERIRKEKKSDAGNAEINGTVKEKLAHAQALFEAGRIDEARASLDEAYASAKVAIEHLRGGDTVVRSLNFATKEEEYRYERDRNDTHRMLLTGLLDEKTDRPELRKQTQPFIDRAADLRQKAESAAASGDYEKATGILEQSTAELVRAIRASGVYIPG